MKNKIGWNFEKAEQLKGGSRLERYLGGKIGRRVKKFNKEDKKLSKRISSMREFRLKREFLTNTLISGLQERSYYPFF